MGGSAGLIAKTPEVKKEISNSRMQKTVRPRSMGTSADSIRFLQRTAGNQAVSRLIRSRGLQAKLRIGQPGDMYEQEADRVADAVMRMPEMGVQWQVEPEEEKEEEETLQSKPLANQITPLVQRQLEPVEEEEEEKQIQPKNNTGMAPQVTPGVTHDIHSFKGTGQPLPASERAFFEPRFRRDFSNVRVHNDMQAAHAARSISARAFTHGRDVVFGAGEYSSGTPSGRKLLAHELAHAVQQGVTNRPYVAREKDKTDGNDIWLGSGVLQDDTRLMAHEATHVVQQQPILFSEISRKENKKKNLEDKTPDQFPTYNDDTKPFQLVQAKKAAVSSLRPQINKPIKNVVDKKKNKGNLPFSEQSVNEMMLYKDIVLMDERIKLIKATREMHYLLGKYSAENFVGAISASMGKYMAWLSKRLGNYAVVFAGYMAAGSWYKGMSTFVSVGSLAVGPYGPIFTIVALALEGAHVGEMKQRFRAQKKEYKKVAAYLTHLGSRIARQDLKEFIRRYGFLLSLAEVANDRMLRIEEFLADERINADITHNNLNSLFERGKLTDEEEVKIKIYTRDMTHFWRLYVKDYRDYIDAYYGLLNFSPTMLIAANEIKKDTEQMLRFLDIEFIAYLARSWIYGGGGFDPDPTKFDAYISKIGPIKLYNFDPELRDIFLKWTLDDLRDMGMNACITIFTRYGPSMRFILNNGNYCEKVVQNGKLYLGITAHRMAHDPYYDRYKKLHFWHGSYNPILAIYLNERIWQILRKSSIGSWKIPVEIGRLP